MKFYRRLSAIKAISFDLDDNLYSNKPVMQAIEKKMIAYFAKVLARQLNSLPSQYKEFSSQFWCFYRKQAIRKQADLTHDVVKVRLVSYHLGLIKLGYPTEVALKMAQEAVDYFITLRSDFSVPQRSKALLGKLSLRFPLVAISNGNVDTKAIGIGHYFKKVYHAGWQKDGTLLKQKPATDMFDLACQQLAIKPEQLLHVGDCGRSDVQGALRAGCQTAWLSCYDVGKPITVLPHIELSDITQLAQL